ncbi:MAG: flagellar type III secretion system pore protein FliP [Lentisphaerales bacterium]|nr:flagellar type III secretion system pore protein FliP [Lentisphaerales bacterium]
MIKGNKTALLFFALTFFCPAVFGQAEIGQNDIGIKFSLEGQSFSKAVNIFLLLTMLSIVPSLIMMMTSFTRIVIVLNFLKQAMGTQSVPSPKIVSSLALFLSVFIMYPVYNQVYNDAIIPFSNEELSEKEAIEKGIGHVKDFMLNQTRDSDLIMFMDLAGQDPVKSAKELSLRIIIPAFMISELKTAFQMGFLIYLPFLVIDLVIATLLMAMGMMMLPPVMISLPFKLLLFILVDGWGLLIYSLVSSFG